MKLYHGTSFQALESILEKGIQPRAASSSPGNWEAISHDQAVYLTDTYALYYAFASAGKNQETDGRAVILEIDTEYLDEQLMAPDEDVMEQSGRGYDGIPGDMYERTEHYRDVIALKQGDGTWRDSLEGMGTCAYFGSVPLEAITRYCLIDKNLEEQKWFAYSVIDTSIAIQSFKVMSGVHKALTHWVFEGDLPELDPMTKILIFPMDQRLSRNGLEVFDLKENSPKISI